MTIWWLVHLTIDSNLAQELADLGLHENEVGEPIKTTGKWGFALEGLHIPDNHPHWPAIRAVILASDAYQRARQAALARKDELDAMVMGKPPNFNVSTTFSDQDDQAAPYLELLAHDSGYPQPQDGFGYRKITYRPGSGCDECGVGFEQVSPFRIKKSVHWGRRSIQKLNWVHDEVFVKPEVWKEIFKPLGVGYREVLSHPKGELLSGVVQLDIPDLVDLQLPEDEPYTDCAVCGQRRYEYHRIGFLPMPAPTDLHVFKARQWVGTGGRFGGYARRQIIVSQHVRQLFEAAKVEGAGYSPCGPPLPPEKYREYLAMVSR